MAEVARSLQASGTELRKSGKNKHAFVRSRYMTLSVNKMDVLNTSRSGDEVEHGEKSPHIRQPYEDEHT